jgi:hypothetical protein
VSPNTKRRKVELLTSDVPLTDKLRQKLQKVIGRNGNTLLGEASIYIDANKCGVGFHGDAHSRQVLGVRLGCSMPLEYQWYGPQVQADRTTEAIHVA